MPTSTNKRNFGRQGLFEHRYQRGVASAKAYCGTPAVHSDKWRPTGMEFTLVTMIVYPVAAIVELFHGR